MSTSVRLTDTQVFPPGTVLKAYQARGGAHPFPGSLPPARGTAPPAAAPVIAEGTMGNEAVTLSGLTDNTAYVVGGQVATVWTWVQIRTEPANTGNVVVEGTAGVSVAEGDARWLKQTDAVSTYSTVIQQAFKETITTASHAVPAGHELLWFLLKATCAFTMPSLEAGAAPFVAILQQDGVGSRGWTFTGVKWTPQGTLPTPSGGINAIDAAVFLPMGLTWLGVPVGENFL